MKLWVSVDVTDEVSLRFGLGCHIRRSAQPHSTHRSKMHSCDDDCSRSGLEMPNSNSLQRSNHG